LLTLIIESISQVYPIADRFLYHQVDKGGIAAMNYALNIFVLPVSIISAALSTALFPKLSKSFTSQSGLELESRMNSFFSVNTFLFVPVVFAFFIYGDFLIKLLFQRGAFSGIDTKMTFDVLKIYSISLIFYSSYVVLNKLLYGAELVKQLLFITIAGCVLKIVLNIILVVPMQQAGLALSTSISYICFFLCSILIIAKKIRIGISKLFFIELIFCMLNAVLSYLVAVVLINAEVFNDTLLIKLAGLIVFLSVYTINAVLMNYKGIILLEDMIKNLRLVRFNNF
jgi:putative peptidoglycan lipid II flippase